VEVKEMIVSDALKLILSAAAGVGLMYFLDPDRGRRRRAIARDRLAGSVRSRIRQGERAGRAASAQVYGVAQQVLHTADREEPPPSDAALKAKVETVLFADQSFPKGRVNVNVEDGRVVLRGELEHPDDITAAETRVRRIAGVRDVENLLHLPNTPARMN
jgi:BON domain